MINIGIVTGASSGIGREFACNLPSDFELDEIWLIARRQERLLEVSNTLVNKYNIKVKILILDLLNDESMRKFLNLINENNYNIKILINAAGFGILGESMNLNRQKQEEMIILNCKSLFSLTHICVNYMQEGSCVIQIASAAALCPQPYFAVYAATKSFVMSYSIALNMELMERNIKVLTVCPGPVDTEFFNNIENKSKKILNKKIIKTPFFIYKKTLKALKNNKCVVFPGKIFKLFSILEGMPSEIVSSYILKKFINK